LLTALPPDPGANPPASEPSPATQAGSKTEW
jgi:hypothetical protein